MVEGSVITDEIRNMIGTDLATEVFEVEKGMILKIAQAVEDPNPLWQDQEYAQKSRYGGIVAPPSIIWAVTGAELSSESSSPPSSPRISSPLRLSPSNRLSITVCPRPAPLPKGRR